MRPHVADRAAAGWRTSATGRRASGPSSEPLPWTTSSCDSGRHEVLGEGVDQAERQLVVMVVAMDRLVMHVAQRVVHPAHVPFQAEAQAAEVGRAARRRSRRSILRRWSARRGCCRCDWMLNSLRNEMASRFSRPPNSLGIHSPFFAAVVEVDHRGHGVNAQAVDVIFVEPEQGVREQEVAHFVAGRS